jgi:hypothetical protein
MPVIVLERKAPEIVGVPDASIVQVAQQLSDEDNVRGLKVMIVSEPEHVLLRYDQS